MFIRIFVKTLDFMAFMIYRAGVKTNSNSWHVMKIDKQGADAQPEIFQGRRSFVELGHFDKYFVKSKRKIGPSVKNLRVFTHGYS